LSEIEERVNDYVRSVILGIIEGLTEFLPVSSTAHLRLTQPLIDIPLEEPYWKMYAIVIQLGAILALPVYFYKRILGFLSTFPRGEHGEKNVLTHPVTLTLIAFVCTAGPAYLLRKQIGENLEKLYIMGLALLIGGIIMWVVDVLCGREAPGSTNPFTGEPETAHMEDMTLGQAVWIGLAQILSAVFPGTSRSMSTIAAGQVAGMTRSAALEFSFFLSMPTMTVAVAYEFYSKVLSKNPEKSIGPVVMDTERWIVLAIGFGVSFIVALVVVHWFLGWVRKHGFALFAGYRIVLGSAVLTWAWLDAGGLLGAWK
jgi:undecaprenyl-diphosphatase